MSEILRKCKAKILEKSDSFRAKKPAVYDFEG